MNRVEGKVAIVTGAGLGLGKAAAAMLAREGARVALTDVKDQEGREAADEISGEIQRQGDEPFYLHHDVAKEDDWRKTIDAVLARWGRLDVLVNNAGVALSANVEETTLEKWRWLMSINLDGVFLGTKHAIPAMKRTGGGSIVNLSSIEGLIGDPDLAAYNASKGGVRIFTKSAALHCAKSGYNIRVNSIHPGYIRTPMVEGIADEREKQETLDALAALHPVGHIGEPDDIAYGVVYLASDESKFMTGSELVIDGGYTAQ